MDRYYSDDGRASPCEERKAFSKTFSSQATFLGFVNPLLEELWDRGLVEFDV